MREGWEYRKLGEVSSFSRGLTFSKDDVAVESSKKVLRSNNIDLATHSLNFDDVACLKEEFVIPSDKKLHQNDIFICMSNGSTQHLGKVAFIEKDLDYAFGGFMGALHPQPSVIYPKFAFYYCMSSEYRRSLASVLNGININNLKWSDLSKFPIPVPLLSEQQRIVSELDLLSSIIEKKKAQLKEYDQLAQSIFYDMFGDPVTNEKGWEVKKLGDCCNNCDSLRKPITAKDRIKGTIPYYGASGIVDYVKDYLFDGEYLLISEDGANLVFRSTPIAFRIKGKTWVNNHAHVLQFDTLFQQIYMEYSINLRDISSIVTGCAQPKLTQAAMNNINIPYPPLPLQQSFASKIEAIERQKALIQQSIAEVQMLFDSRMDDWFA